MDTINTTNPVTNDNAFVVVDETDLSDVCVDIERDLLPIRQGTADEESEAVYDKVLWHLRTDGMHCFCTEQNIRNFIQENSSESLKYCCDEIEGVFGDGDDNPPRPAKRVASEDRDESVAKRVKLAVSGVLQEEIYKREGMPPAAPCHKHGMRREPEIDIVSGDWGMSFRGRQDVYYQALYVAGGVDGLSSSRTQQKTADPDDNIGLVAMFLQYRDEEDLLGEEGEELKAQINYDWDKVKVVEDMEARRV